MKINKIPLLLLFFVMMISMTACSLDTDDETEAIEDSPETSTQEPNNGNEDTDTGNEGDSGDDSDIEDSSDTTDTIDPVPSDGDVITAFTVKEAAEVGSDNFPITVVFPLVYGTFSTADSFQITDADGNLVPAQFEVLNRWWARDNSLRHVMAHFVPQVDAYDQADGSSGVAQYHLVVDSKQAQVAHPVTATEAGNSIELDNGLVAIEIQKEPLKIMTPAGELKSLFYREDGTLDESFNHDDIEFEVEEDGPIRTIVKISSRTLYHSPTDIKHGWALRLYAYADSHLVRAEFQLQNSAINSQLSAPLYFKGHQLRLVTNTSTDKLQLKAETAPTEDILSLPLGYIDSKRVNVYLRNFQQTFPNGLAQDSQGTIDIELWPAWKRQFHDTAYADIDLYWFDDMQQAYKEVLLDFDTTRSAEEIDNLAQTFQFPPVAVVPLNYYAQTKVTMDMSGYVPEQSFALSDTTGSRKPAYSANQYNMERTNSYSFGMDNFGLDVYRKRWTSTAGGTPYCNRKFHVTGNPADFYKSQDFAKGELNLRPQWLSGYVHADHFELLKPTTNPYAGMSWRRFESHGKATQTREYIEGSSRTGQPRDDQHAWFYHIEDSYMQSGNKWIYDWYLFMSEFKKVFVQELDPWPDRSNRSIGHSLGVALSAYRATGDQELIELIGKYIHEIFAPRVREPHMIHASYVKDGVPHAACFQIGFFLRSFIKYYDEVGGDAALLDIIGNHVEWNYSISNFAYYYDATTTTPSSESSGTGISMVDSVMWYAHESGKTHYADHAITFVEEGLNGTKAYGNFKEWKGQYEGRMYRYYREQH